MGVPFRWNLASVWIGNLGDGMDSAAMRAFWAANGGQYSARPQDAGGNAMTSLEEDYVASEDIFASYAMGTWDVGALRIIGGVRVENTQFKAIGNQVDVAANGRSFTVTPRVANSSYTNVLPGLHLRYDAADDWVLRASANKGSAWVRDYLADKRVAGRAAALRADLNDQTKKGNTGEHGQWL